MSTLSERLRDAQQCRSECFDSDGTPIEAAFRDLGFNESHLFKEAADELDRLAAELDLYKKSAAFCKEHQPNGGQRGMCLVCACQNLNAALSRISYLCGPPNDMGASPYDVDCDETAVVARVERLTARVAELEKHERRLEALSTLRSFLQHLLKQPAFGLAPNDPIVALHRNELERWIAALESKHE